MCAAWRRLTAILRDRVVGRAARPSLVVGAALGSAPRLRCSDDSDNSRPSGDDKTKEKLFGGVLLLGVSGVALAGGFSYAFSAVRKQHLDDLVVDREAVRLANRALAWGTFYAILGVSTIVLLISFALGVRSLKEFRDKMQSKVKPRMPQVTPGDPQGRTEFASFRELLEYVSEPQPAPATPPSQ